MSSGASSMSCVSDSAGQKIPPPLRWRGFAGCQWIGRRGRARGDQQRHGAIIDAPERVCQRLQARVVQPLHVVDGNEDGLCRRTRSECRERGQAHSMCPLGAPARPLATAALSPVLAAAGRGCWQLRQAAPCRAGRTALQTTCPSQRPTAQCAARGGPSLGRPRRCPPTGLTCPRRLRPLWQARPEMSGHQQRNHAPDATRPAARCRAPHSQLHHTTVARMTESRVCARVAYRDDDLQPDGPAATPWFYGHRPPCGLGLPPDLRSRTRFAGTGSSLASVR